MMIAYWVVIVLGAAFCLRLACGIMSENIPSWKRSIISVVVVTFFAYLAFDFTAYLIMRSMDGVLLRLPRSPQDPNEIAYGYNLWFREPLALKLHIISHAGPVRHAPYVFAVCALGFFQVLALQGEVNFRKALLIAFMQTAGAALTAYIASLLFGLVLFPTPGTPPSAGAQPKGAPTEKRDGSPQMIEEKVKDAVEATRDYLENAGTKLKTYADTHLNDLEKELDPFTQHLPEPVKDWLKNGGWWIVLGGLGVIAILWARSLFSKLRRAGRKSKKKSKKKKVTKVKAVKLAEDLASIGDAYTDEGEQRVLVKGLPARLRLVVLSQGNKNPGGLREDMADRVLDWIKHGLAEATAQDYPRVRVWPPFYDAGGFATNLAKNVVIPEPKGTRSHWIVVAGRVEMGLSIINVGLAFYADEESTVRNVTIKGDNWLDVLGVQSGVSV
jgi:hypothetical protein